MVCSGEGWRVRRYQSRKQTDSYDLLRFGRRDSAGSQVMMRGRIVAQAFTVGALMVGVVLNIKNKTWVKPSSQEEFQAAASNTK